MEEYTILSGEGNITKFQEALLRLIGLGILSETQRERLIESAALGTGHSLSFEEATHVVNFAFDTMMQASILNAVIAGHLDIAVDEEGNISFGTTELGEKATQEFKQMLERESE